MAPGAPRRRVSRFFAARRTLVELVELVDGKVSSRKRKGEGMKKSSVILMVLSGAAVAALVVFTDPGQDALARFGLASGEASFLKARTQDFLEDIQFKDFTTAATYHLPEAQEARDIPSLIRRVFFVKHEVLDIHDYRITEVDFDRSGARARVRAFVRYHVLGDKSTRDQPGSQREVEMLFYWFKQKGGAWAMELESSLRSGWNERRLRLGFNAR